MSRQVNTIFCDDIRQEVGNKVSYIGVYAGRLYVRDIPLTLPKLCVDVAAITPAENPFKKLKFKILMGESVLFEAEVDEKALETSSETLFQGFETDSDKLMVAGARVVLSPFNIEEPGILRVHVETESELLKGAALRIEVVPPDDSAS